MSFFTPPPASALERRLIALLVPFAFLGSACSPNMPDVAGPTDHVINKSLTSASSSPAAAARLAQLDGKQMRVRAYTKSNGPRRLVASQALKFERVGSSLKLTPRAESLAPVFIGNGVELVGSRGYAQALPPCDENYALQDWGVTCALPFCDEVDYVEPCDPGSPPEGEEGGGPGLYEELISDPEYLGSIAVAYQEVSTFMPTTQDSLSADSLGLVFGDTLGVLVGVATNQDGRVAVVVIEENDWYSTISIHYNNGAVSGLLQQLVTVDGDTVDIEVTEELTESQLREDSFLLSQAKMYAYDGSCPTEEYLLRQAYMKAGAFGVSIAVNYAISLIPGGFVAKVALTAVVGGFGLGGEPANIISIGKGLSFALKKTLNTVSGIGLADALYDVVTARNALAICLATEGGVV